MAVIAGLDDPLAVLLPDDPSNVVRPHDNRADPRGARPAPMGPIARQVIARARIGPDQTPHLPAAPGSRPPLVMPR